MPKEREPPYFDLKTEGKVQVPEQQDKVTFLDRKQAVVDYRRHLDTIVAQQQAREEGTASQERAAMQILTTQPWILVVGSGDWHLGSSQVDYGLFKKHMELIRDTDGLYVCLVGDLIDNFIKPRLKVGLFEGVADPQSQAVVVMGLLTELEDKNKILARTTGNHELWTWEEGGIHLEDFWHNQLKSPLLRNGGFVHIKVNGIEYVCWLHHGKSLFNSNFNPNHASKRAFEFMGPYDFAFTGHMHTAEAAHSYRWIDEYQKDYAQLRVGTYKTDDQYARSKQLGRGQPPGACILLNSDEKRMVPFLKLEDGIAALKALNSIHYLIVTGILEERRQERANSGENQDK